MQKPVPAYLEELLHESFLISVKIEETCRFLFFLFIAGVHQV